MGAAKPKRPRLARVPRLEGVRRSKGIRRTLRSGCMPHSPHWSISTMIEHVVRLQPRSVMDVGHGYGKWGFLIREALDFVGQRHAREEWAVRIDGLDAFPQSSPLLEWAYNNLEVADVLTVSGEISGYDVVLLGDVIEHMPKHDGIRLLTELLNQNRSVLVNTPRAYFEQHDIGGNPFERHRSYWSPDDFSRWPADIDVRGGTLIVALRGSHGSYPSPGAVRASRIVRRIPGLREHGAASTAVKEALRAYVFPEH